MKSLVRNLTGNALCNFTSVKTKNVGGCRRFRFGVLIRYYIKSLLSKDIEDILKKYAKELLSKGKILSVPQSGEKSFALHYSVEAIFGPKVTVLNRVRRPDSCEILRTADIHALCSICHFGLTTAIGANAASCLQTFLACMRTAPKQPFTKS